MARPRLGIGLIGGGFMGRTHSFGYATAMRVFDLPFEISLEVVAERDATLAEAARHSLGFARATCDWRQLLEDPRVDLIDITTPNDLHRDMALAAVAAGKHVYCEKPLATNALEAAEMATAAEHAGVRTQVGFNYLANPMLHLAREMIRGGELGEIRSYRGIHAEDYMAAADTPWNWRLDPECGGVMGDLGSHALATAEFLLGPIAELLGDQWTVIPIRPGPRGGATPVEVEDIARALLRFESGATGSLEASWVATGRKMQHDFEVTGSDGALAFSQERLNELAVYRCDDPAGRQGFRTIVAGPEHTPYGRFCPAPGHQLGFNDLKAIEIAGFVEAIAGAAPEPFNFRAGHRVQRLVDLVHCSAAEGRWLVVDGEGLQGDPF